MTTINYSREVSAEGRNGFMKQTGIEILQPGKEIQLFPMNTRGIGRGMMEIPEEDLPEFIQALLPEFPVNIELGERVIPAESNDDTIGELECSFVVTEEILKQAQLAASVAETFKMTVAFPVSDFWFKEIGFDFVWKAQEIRFTPGYTPCVIGYTETGSEVFAYI